MFELRVSVTNWTLTFRVGIRVESVSMSTDPNFLLRFGFNEQSMFSACISAPIMVALVLFRIVPHHEVIITPTSCVVVDESQIHFYQVVFNTHVE